MIEEFLPHTVVEEELPLVVLVEEELLNLLARSQGLETLELKKLQMVGDTLLLAKVEISRRRVKRSSVQLVSAKTRSVRRDLCHARARGGRRRPTR